MPGGLFGPRALQGQSKQCIASFSMSQLPNHFSLRRFALARPRRISGFPTRAEYRPQQTNPRQNLPVAPPARSPPPPPPPPVEELNINISRRALAAIMIGGSVAWYSFLKAGVPFAGIDRQRNIALLKTKKGNIIAATQDEAGRLFMFDKAGNIYYDTEDPQVGIYIVDTAGEMYNEFVDQDGNMQQTYIGNISNMTSIKVSEVGGVSMEELQKSVKGFRGGRVVGFPKVPDANGLAWENLMPPNAPARVPSDGRVQPPPILEDMEIDLEPKGGLFGGGGGGSATTDPEEILKTLRRK